MALRCIASRKFLVDTFLSDYDTLFYCEIRFRWQVMASHHCNSCSPLSVYRMDSGSLDFLHNCSAVSDLCNNIMRINQQLVYNPTKSEQIYRIFCQYIILSYTTEFLGTLFFIVADDYVTNKIMLIDSHTMLDHILEPNKE